MALEIVRLPLLSLSADAVVSHANVGLQYASGLCGEIFDAAGRLALQHALCAIGSCEVGKAVATEGFALSAKHIIHTVPPRWCGGKHGEDLLLGDCYANSLRLARRLGARSVAFPLLSEESCGYPADRGLRVACEAIRACPDGEPMRVFLALPADAGVGCGRKAGECKKNIQCSP